MTTGRWVLLSAVLVTLGLGLCRGWSGGRFRGTRRVRGAGRTNAAQPPRTLAQGGVLAGTAYAGQLGARATLLQFSSAFCAPCRATRQTLATLAELVPGVVHVEVDAESHLDLVRRLGVLRTPTTLVLDAAGRETTRAAGAPRREQVLAALAAGNVRLE